MMSPSQMLDAELALALRVCSRSGVRIVFCGTTSGASRISRMRDLISRSPLDGRRLVEFKIEFESIYGEPFETFCLEPPRTEIGA